MNVDYGCDHCRLENQLCCSACGGPEGLYCTRPAGHSGDHVDCGISEDEHPMSRWSQDQGDDDA